MLWRGAISVLLAAGIVGAAPLPPALKITYRTRTLKPGELVILTISSTTGLSTPEVKAFGRTLQVQAVPPTTTTPHAWTAFAGIDLEVRPGSHTVSVSATSASGPVTATRNLAVRAKTFATRRLTVNPDFVNPPESEAARIELDAARLAAAMEGTTRPGPAPEWAFLPPVPQKANSAFGTRSIFNGEPRNSHSGADFPSPAGTPIESPAAGKVMLADDLYYSGNTVVVDHGMGIVSLFAHMSKIAVEAGAEVSQKDVLGLVGATGRVTGPHLHWTVRVNGARVDPLSLLILLRPTRVPSAEPQSVGRLPKLEDGP